LLLNFSTMQHSCRKCLCSRSVLCRADTYKEIAAKNHVPRSNEMLKENYYEAQTIGRTHVNSVGHLSLFTDFPFFDIPKQLPQCSSHDYLEGCVKLWIKIIFEHFVKIHWITWENLEKLIDSFPYRYKDADSKPAVMLGKKMKVKSTRKIIGTFAEIGTLIRSCTQVIYDHILDPTDEHYLWLLKIREFLRYIQMIKLTEGQLIQMENILEEMMDLRMKLTRIPDSEQSEEGNLSDQLCGDSDNIESDSDDSGSESDSDSEDKFSDDPSEKVPKYKPPIRFKGCKIKPFFLFSIL
jgi:hypothetical protein